jgi:hypothetical protein
VKAQIAHYLLLWSLSNLHLTENLLNALKSIKGSSDTYSILNKDTGQMYIGSLVDLGARLADLFVIGSSNVHLQNAMAKYGLFLFLFQPF